MHSRSRILYLDLIRIISCIMVVMVHISAQLSDVFSKESIPYIIVFFYNCISFSGVALFVMISGAVFLNPAKEINIKTLLCRYVLHAYIIYYIWKAFYHAIVMLEIQEPFNYINIKNEIILASVLKRGMYHLWFLPIIAILYMFIPLIKKSVSDKKTCIYFLSIFFIVEILFPTLFLFEFRFKYLFEAFFENNNFYLFSGYLGYFVLGHYLHNWRAVISTKQKIIVYIISGCSVILCLFLGDMLNTPFSITSFFMAIAIFTAIQTAAKQIETSVHITKILTISAKGTLGVYLLHPLIISMLFSTELRTIAIARPIIVIPIVTICIFVICNIFSMILLKIPVLKRLIQ